MAQSAKGEDAAAMLTEFDLAGPVPRDLIWVRAVVLLERSRVVPGLVGAPVDEPLGAGAAGSTQRCSNGVPRTKPYAT
jgi:hypothetical protein